MKTDTKFAIDVVVHFYENDLKCNGEYHSVDLILSNKKGDDIIVINYGDEYHDKGLVKARANVSLLRELFKENILGITEIMIPDIEL